MNVKNMEDLIWKNSHLLYPATGLLTFPLWLSSPQFALSEWMSHSFGAWYCEVQRRRDENRMGWEQNSGVGEFSPRWRKRCYKNIGLWTVWYFAFCVLIDPPQNVACSSVSLHSYLVCSIWAMMKWCCIKLKHKSQVLLYVLFSGFFRLQDSLEFINQDSNTLKPDHSTIMNGLLGNIGNYKMILFPIIIE